MIVTEIYKGQGLGNQLACYIATRVIALDKGYDFGIQSPQNFKGSDFLTLDFGKKVIGGSGPEGGPAVTLPNSIEYYYRERQIIHPLTGADIRTYDSQLMEIFDNTKIDGLLQDEQYILHHKEDIRQWLKVTEAYECFEYANDNTCVINFRGGEYARHPEFFLEKKYWQDAVAQMLTINKNFRFIVITDDVFEGKKMFPNYSVFHFSIGKDYSIIKNAHYLILSNSSFAWFPSWLSENLKYCIAPKYWARHNVSDGYWSLGYNITSGWHYMDRDGVLHDYDQCLAELQTFMATHPELYLPSNKAPQAPMQKGMKAFLKRHIPVGVKNIIKSVINEAKNVYAYVRQPFDLIAERKREKHWLSKTSLAEYRKTMKIYDAFNFYNELETLEIRLNILDPYVDYFVIAESTMTHSGMPKELFFEKNKSLFKKFEHKIIHYIIDDPLKDFEDAEQRLKDPSLSAIKRSILQTALTSDNVAGAIPSLRIFYEKECLKIPLMGLADNDFCFISDLDEIWNPEAFFDYSKDDIFKFKQDNYMYYLNNRSNEDWSGWTGTIGTQYKNIKNGCLNHLRTVGKNTFTVIRNGGWHFTWQGGAKRVKNKLESYDHQEFNTEDTKANIEQNILNNKDIRGKYIRFWIDESTLPKYLLENKDKYKDLFK